jgi:hypothetical protein
MEEIKIDSKEKEFMDLMREIIHAFDNNVFEKAIQVMFDYRAEYCLALHFYSDATLVQVQRVHKMMVEQYGDFVEINWETTNGTYRIEVLFPTTMLYFNPKIKQFYEYALMVLKQKGKMS